jgi:hypothetical protein
LGERNCEGGPAHGKGAVRGATKKGANCRLDGQGMRRSLHRRLLQAARASRAQGDGKACKLHRSWAFVQHPLELTHKAERTSRKVARLSGVACARLWGVRSSIKSFERSPALVG